MVRGMVASTPIVGFSDDFKKSLGKEKEHYIAQYFLLLNKRGNLRYPLLDPGGVEIEEEFEENRNPFEPYQVRAGIENGFT